MSFTSNGRGFTPVPSGSGGGGGSGAIAINVTSENNTVTMNSQSYNSMTQTLNVDLSAISSSNIPTLIYVSSSGNDSTGDGSIALPFATISAANAYIVDNSITKPYTIYVTPGIYTDNNFSPKPYITYNLNGATYNVVAQITLDSSWASNSGVLKIENGNLIPQGGVSLDFNVAASPNVLVYLLNLTTDTYNPLFSLVGYASGNNKLIIENFKGDISPVGNQLIFAESNFDAFINNVYCYSFQHQKTSSVSLNRNISYISNVVTTAPTNDFTIDNSSTVDATVYLESCNNNSPLYMTFSSGQLFVNEKARNGILNPVELNGLVIWITDNITDVPTLSNGASFIPFTIADGMDANHTPVNYSAANDSVQAAIAGIDTALGTKLTSAVTSVTSANADIAVSNSTTTPVLTANTGVGPSQIVKLDVSGNLPAVPSGTTNVTDPTVSATNNLQSTINNLNTKIGATSIKSINSDTTAAQTIAAGTGISVNTVAGTTTITNTSAGGASIATQAQTDAGYSTVLALGVGQTKIYNSKTKFLPTNWGVPQRNYLANNPWIIRTASANSLWKSVCWATAWGVAVAVSTSGTVMTSPDCKTWTSQTAAAANSWNCVTYIDNISRLVAVSDSGTNRVMTSDNGGVTWTSRSAAATSGWQSVCFGPGLNRLVAVASSGAGNRVMTSDDGGVTWTGRTAATADAWNCVTWSEELALYCAVATSGTVMTSLDGITWTSQIAATANSWQSVCWSKRLKLFIAVSSSGTGDRVMTSGNGTSWLSQVSAADNNWQNICSAEEIGLLIAVANSGTGNRVMTSSDAITWTTGVSAADSSWNFATWIPELGCVCAVAGAGTGAATKVMTTRSAWSYVPTANTPLSVTLADASGAALAITTNYCNYTYNPTTRTVMFNASVTYPSTANTNAVAISGLPGPASPVTEFLLNYFASTGSISTQAFAKFSGSNIILVTTTNTSITNNLVASGTFQMSGSYTI